MVVAESSVQDAIPLGRKRKVWLYDPENIRVCLDRALERLTDHLDNGVRP